MYIDFHCHVKLSKNLDFNLQDFYKLVRRAKRQGLDAFVITEHINSSNLLEIFEVLEKKFEYKHDFYEINGVKVFTGLEVDIQEFRGQILLIGNREDIKIIATHLLSKQETPQINQLLDYADGFEVIKIGAHPFRSKHPLKNIDGGVLKRLDFLELNAKDISRRKELYLLKKLLNMNCVAGSDTHHRFQLGCVSNELLNNCESIKDLRESLYSNRYKIHISRWIYVKKFLAGILKKHEKKRRIIKIQVNN